VTAPDGAGPQAAHQLPAAHYHGDTDALRFWVLLPDQSVIGASIQRHVLQHRFQGRADGSDALAVYAAHRALIDVAVARRAAQGAREPVMLREHDLPVPAR